MGNYITETDIESRMPTAEIVRLTDDEGDVGVITTLAAAKTANSSIEGRIAEAINDAEAMIDTYLRDRYEVPVDPSNSTLEMLGVNLATWYLFARRAGELKIPESVQLKYDEAVKVLEKLAMGKLKLGIEPQPTTSAGQPAKAESVPTTRQFTQSTLEDF